MADGWKQENDDPRLYNYRGPYDRQRLKQACDSLHYMINRQDTVIWRRISSKTGVNSRNPSDIWGQHSSYFSHAELPENKAIEEPYGRWFDDDDNVPSTSSFDQDDVAQQDTKVNLDLNHGERNKPGSSKTATVTSANADDLFVLDYKGNKLNADVEPSREETNSQSISNKNAVDLAETRKHNSSDKAPSSDIQVLDNSDCEIVADSGLEPKYIVIEAISDLEDGEIIDEESEQLRNRNRDSQKRKSDAVDNESSKKVKTDPNIDEAVQVHIELGSAHDHQLKSADKALNHTKTGVVNGNVISSISSAKAGTSSQDYGTQGRNMNTGKKMYQCDYCQLVTEVYNEIINHLKHAIHASASLVLADKEGNVAFMLTPGAVRDNYQLYKSKIITCPLATCNVVFDNLQSCCEHNACHQKNGEQIYAMADVKGKTTFEVTNQYFDCQVCGLDFPKLKQLTKHMKNENHMPFSKDDDTIVYYYCNYCQQVLYSYVNIYNHVMIKHGQSRDKNGKYMLEALHVSKNKMAVHCIPFSADMQGEKASVRAKVAGLKGMIQGASKSSKKKIKKSIRDLKQTF